MNDIERKHWKYLLYDYFNRLKPYKKYGGYIDKDGFIRHHTRVFKRNK